MFGGLELKGSNEKKRDGDSHSDSVTSGFSFLQTSVTPSNATNIPASSSGFSFISLETPIAPTPIVEDTPATMSSFSFLSTAPPPPSPSQVNPATSAFSFLDTPQTPSLTSSYGDDILSMLPVVATNVVPVPVPAMDTKSNESTTHLNDFGLSAIESVSQENLPTRMPSTLDSSTVHQPWGSTSSLTEMGGDMTIHSHDEDMKNATTAIGAGVVFGGAASSKVGGSIKKRSRTYKVGTGASSDAGVGPLTINDGMNPPTIESQSISSNQEESHVTVSDIVPVTDTPHSRTSSVAEDAEKALQRAAEFIEEKNNEATKVKANEPVVLKESSVDRVAALPKKDNTYQQAAAAAQEAKGIMKQSSATSFMSGLFKRSGAGIPSFSSHASSNASKASSVTPSIKITSASVDPDTRGYGKSSNTHLDPINQTTRLDHPAPISNSWTKPTDTVIDTKEQLNPIHQDLPVETRKDKSMESNQQVSSKVENEALPSKTKVEVGEPLRETTVVDTNVNTTVPEPKVSPKELSNTPSYLLNSILNDFFACCIRTNELIERLKGRKSSLLSNLSAASKELQLTAHRINQAESHQMIAAEREEFDLAESLASDIDKYTNRKIELQKMVQKDHEGIQDIEKQRQSAIDSLASQFQDVYERLSTFKKDQETFGRENIATVLEQFAITSKRFSVENDRLASDLKNIERDEAFVEQERKELESQISDQCHDLYHLRDTARDQLVSIEREIEELRKLLAAKETHASELTLLVAQHEASIAQVRSKFSRQLTRVEKKEMAVKESRNDWEGEISSFKKQKDKHDAEVSAHSEYLLAKERIISQTQREIGSIGFTEVLIMKEILVDDINGSVDTSGLADLEGSVVVLEVAVDEAKQALTVAQSSVDRIQNEIISIEARLPALEVEKRDAASKRDFKAASKASKEIKDLSARREECETILTGESKNQVEQALKDLETVSSELSAKKELVQAKNGELARAQMVEIAKRVRKLNTLKDKAIIGVDTNIESDSPSVVSSVAITIIDSQLLSLVSQGQELGSSHGSWNEILEREMAISRNTVETEESGDEHDDVVISGPKLDQVTETCNDGGLPACGNDISIECAIPSTDSGQSIQEEIVQPVDDDNATKDKDSAIIRYKEISMTLKILEREIEKAVSDENYEEAAELEDAVHGLRAEIEKLGVSEEDLVHCNDCGENVSIEESDFESPQPDISPDDDNLTTE